VALNETRTFSPALPFLVVITITPLPAWTPQIEAAAASLSIVTLSISFGLILLNSPSYGKLSTTMSGLGLAKIVLRPRMLIAALFARTGKFLLNINPFVTPSNLSRIFVLTLRFNNSLSICTKLPVALSLGILSRSEERRVGTEYRRRWAVCLQEE